jgi:hypothetical protein
MYRLSSLLLGIMCCCASGPSADSQVLRPGSDSLRHAAMLCEYGAICYAGAALGAPPGTGLAELNITNTGTPPCINNAPITSATDYHQLCLGANALGGGLVSYNAYGGVTRLPLHFNINEKTYPFPATVLSPLSSTLRITPPADSLSQGFVVSQSASGSGAGPQIFNWINVTSDNSASGEALFHEALLIQHNFGGSSMIGGVNALEVHANLTSPTSSRNHNNNYVGVFGRASAKSGDGGIGTAQTSAKGAVFGAGFLGTAFNGATNLLNLVGAELDVEAQAGSSGWLKEGLSLVSGATPTGDTVAFTHNPALTVASEGSPNIGWDTAISVNDFHSGTRASPLWKTGCVLCAQSETVAPGEWTVGTGIDLSLFNVTGYLLKGYNNVAITGAGGFHGSGSGDGFPPSVSTGWAITDNYLHGPREVVLWNTDTKAAKTLSVRQQTGSATSVEVLSSAGGNLDITGAYSVNGTVGVSCSGLPSALFATKNGIVTHC